MLGTYRSNRGPVCLVKLGTLVYHVSVCLKKKREKEKKSIKIPCALLFTGSPTWSIARAIPSPRTGRRIEATSPTDRYVDHSIPLIGAVPLVTARNRSVTVDFDCRRPLPSGISLAAAWLWRGRRKKKREKREKKRENLASRSGIALPR
ncbi:hypothetical protein BHE74_00000260 [Ensete ventricosum]|nr:hypothetical protein BHE74_00000260 [Ensete ventricosum]